VADLVCELRAFRRWPFPLLAVGVAVFTVVLMPINAGYGPQFLNGDAESYDEQLELYYTDLVFTRSSGQTAGQILALVLGAALVLVSKRSARLSLPRLGAAMIGGLFLAAINAAVALRLAAMAAPDTLDSVEGVRAVGMTFAADPLHDPGVLRVLLSGLAAFPLYAAAGAIWAAVIRQWQWWVLISLSWVPGSLFGWFTSVGTEYPNAVVPFLLDTLVPPAATIASAQVTADEQYTNLALGAQADSYPPTVAAVAVLAGPVLYAGIGYVVASWRRKARARNGVATAVEA
jgi:hypothetical protein